ncbi:reverse transcriptase-like protein [Metabacillus litoralis]|uniref:reverse transcriptase-like protein n=1 Tax=Metabacillus litoralis TaxID=152268 RepID=UPI001CFEB651|nr:reverse transcriptase-like protein [Metabacillus litoralis]
MKYRIEWTYITKKKLETNLVSEYLSLNEAIMLAEDFIQTGRVKNLQYISEDSQTWNLKELKKLRDIVKDEPHDVVAFFDGGFQKSTSLAGFGAVIYYTQSGKRYRIRMNEKVEGLSSNNEAEYAAFAFLVNVLEENGISKQKIHFLGDSQVVLNQLSGEWPCYEEEFNVWLDKIENNLKKLKIIPNYESISRKENTEADKLATQAMEGIDISSKLIIDEEVEENE